MKRVTFVVAGFVVVVLTLLLTKPEDINKTKNKKNNIVFHEDTAVKTFE